MGDLPTVQDVYSRTDMEFHQAYPDAPERLDAGNPDHANWIEEWGRIRVEVCNRWTDQQFYDRYPIGRPLDTSNPDDAEYIEFWNDIREQIDGRGGRWDWTASVSSSAAQADAQADPAPTTADEPPTYQDYERGKEITQYYIGPIIEFGHEFAENLATLPEHPTAGIIQSALESFITGAEVFGAHFPPVTAVLGPFLMWYEAIGANDAGERATNRWRVYNAFINGYLSGLHMRDGGPADPAFLQPVLDSAFMATSNLSDSDRRAVKAYLLENSSLDGGRSLSADNPKMDARKWQNHEGGWTHEGLVDLMTHADHN